MKKAIQSLFKHFGLDIRRRQAEDLAMGYAGVYPNATHAPWLTDDKFKKLQLAIAGHTLVDCYRLYELWSLLKAVSRVRGDILEVGVGGAEAPHCSRHVWRNLG